jgi:hypothetical protein
MNAAYKYYPRFYSDRAKELKVYNKVPEILARYGVEIRRGRCRGFCHNGNDFNMSIREDYCKCFVCGRSFDIFDVVMFFEDCDFKRAFEILGGNVKPSLTAYRKTREIISEMERKKKEKAERDEQYWEYIRLLVNFEDYTPKKYKDLDLSALTLSDEDFDYLMNVVFNPSYTEACQKLEQAKFNNSIS